ncbi:MAG: hypothetical protein U5L06_00710 [Rhodovibrio sp.]|nr:hypothetical protein [Rhodovibrio sp.]
MNTFAKIMMAGAAYVQLAVEWVKAYKRAVTIGIVVAVVAVMLSACAGPR